MNLPIPATLGREWSPYQSAIFNFITDDTRSLNIEARAGSGKTTTIIHAASLAPDVAFLAFNKSAADKLRSTVPNASTFHSLGNSFLRGSGLEFDKTKLAKAAKKLLPNEDDEPNRRAVRKLVDLARGNGLAATDADFLSLIDTFDIDVRRADDERTIIRTAARIMDDFTDRRKLKTYDFTDMLFLPVAFDLPAPRRFSTIFVDEAQDTAAIQRALLHKILAPNGRVIAVGDTFQSIYGFRGADSSAMARLKSEFNSAELPLSICYRCPASVIEVAQRIVPDIQPRPGAPVGRVTNNAELPPPQELTKDDLIICRNNAPLFKVALTFLRERRPMAFQGDLNERLSYFIRSFKTDDPRTLEKRLHAHLESESVELTRMKRMSRLAALVDKVECVLALIPGHETVEDILATIELLFVQSAYGTTISSIHRAKGAEAKRVWFVEPELIPSKYATQDWMRQQENNLYYVAVTRALEELNFVPARRADEDAEI